MQRPSPVESSSGVDIQESAQARIRAGWAFFACRLGFPGEEYGHMKLQSVLGDITLQKVDAVVNAANNALVGGSGVNGAIHRAAGPMELSEACSQLGGCDTGDAKVTPGFRLAAKWIIHTVGPVYYDGRRGEPELLAKCYRRCLELADGLGAESIAFPAISTGIFGYPAGEAARIAVGTILGSGTNVELVVLVAFDAATADTYEKFLKG